MRISLSLSILLALAACGDDLSALAEADPTDDAPADETNQPPVPVSPQLSITTSEDGPVTIDVTAVDPEGTALSYTTTVPQHGAIAGEGPIFIYTPAINYSGTDQLVATISDAVNSVDVPVTITIVDVVECGDGVAEGDEECDDGDADDDQACMADCTLPPTVCGDGDQEGGETCDDGNTDDGDGCSDACQVEGCGDGLVQFSLGETCDDGNTDDGDGCSDTCQVEPFVTVAPVLVSGALSCTTAVANAARKVALDSSSTIYAVMQCGASAHVVVSSDRGNTYSAPLDLGVADVQQVAVAAGPSGVAYVAFIDASNAVLLRTTEDSGATWGEAVTIGQTTGPSAGLSFEAFNDDIYVGYAGNSGVELQRNGARGVGAFEPTSVAMLIAFFDLLFDDKLGTLIVAADSPEFHLRKSENGGVTFEDEVNPSGLQYYSDWAVGNGVIYTSGIFLFGDDNSTLIYAIATDALGTSTPVSGLPSVSTPQSRTLAADTSGNAYVASQLDAGGVQLDRLTFEGSAFDAPRAIHGTGESPIVAELPGARGAIVLFTVGTEVYATVQAY